MIQFKYRPDVDGLRAVAVVLVLLFHAGLGFTGGFVGVDVFFVISGFLITGLILKEQDAGKFSLANFWLRRIRRILPAATVMVVVVLAAGGLLLLPHSYEDLGKSAMAQQLMASNVYFWRNAGYFDDASELKPLLHTWSLAVEEQFYLGYPFLLIGLYRWGRRATGIALALLGAGSFAISVYGVQHHPEATFYLLPTRAWELLIGGLVCFLPPPTRVPAWCLASISWFALAAILGASWLYDSVTPFPGVAALLPCAATAALIYANSQRLTLPASALASKPVVFVGLISYSLYLWHWPVLAFSRYWMGDSAGPAFGLLAIAASVPLAIASWKYIETPLRTGLSGYPPRLVVSAAGLSAAAIIGIAVAIQATEGWDARWPEPVRNLAVACQEGADVTVELDAIRQGRLPLLGADEGGERTPDFLLWGDSHAMSLGACLDAAAKERNLCGAIAARSVTVPLMDVWRPLSRGKAAEALSWNQAVLDFVRRSEIKHVILVARWELYVEGLPNGQKNLLIARRNESDAAPATARTAFDDGLTRTLDELESLGVRVWVLKQVPLQRFDPPRAIIRSMYWGGEMPAGVSIAEHQERQKNANAIIDRNVAGRRWASAADLSAFFFNEQQRSMLGDARGSFYRDDDHVSDLGARVFCRPILDALLSEIEGQGEAAHRSLSAAGSVTTF